MLHTKEQANSNWSMVMPFKYLLKYKLTKLLVLQSRFDILKIHSRKMNLMRGIDLRKIAEKMNGASGAELKVCNPFFTSACDTLVSV